MSPEDKAQLRYLLRQSQQLPQPVSQLLARASRRHGFGAKKIPTIQEQQRQQQRQTQKQERQTQKIIKQEQMNEMKTQTKLQNEKLKKEKKIIKARLAFKKDIEKENQKLEKLKKTPDILKQAEIIKIMNQNLEAGIY